MLTGIIVFFHVMACLTLIMVILLQVGRGHGLSGASFSQSGVQTVFGTRTADFLSKATSVMAVIFVITCITLDILQVRKSRSLFTGPRAGATKLDMEKIRQALEKIKAEEAAKAKTGGVSAGPEKDALESAEAPTAGPEKGAPESTGAPAAGTEVPAPASSEAGTASVSESPQPSDTAAPEAAPPSSSETATRETPAKGGT